MRTCWLLVASLKSFQRLGYLPTEEDIREAVDTTRAYTRPTAEDRARALDLLSLDE